MQQSLVQDCGSTESDLQSIQQTRSFHRISYSISIQGSSPTFDGTFVEWEPRNTNRPFSHHVLLDSETSHSFVLANLMLIPLGLLAIKTGSLLIRIPRRVLLPLILLFCIVGSYAMNGSYFDVGIMLVMGVIGFVFDRFKVPLGPVVLGIILGGEVEHRFIQCIQQIESPLDFVGSGISIAIACWKICSFE